MSAPNPAEKTFAVYQQQSIELADMVRPVLAKYAPEIRRLLIDAGYDPSKHLITKTFFLPDGELHDWHNALYRLLNAYAELVTSGEHPEQRAQLQPIMHAVMRPVRQYQLKYNISPDYNVTQYQAERAAYRGDIPHDLCKTFIMRSSAGQLGIEGAAEDKHTAALAAEKTRGTAHAK